MPLTLPALIVLVVIAGVCGAIGKALAGGGRNGLLASFVLGFIGALLGPWLAHQLHFSEPLMLNVSGQPFPIVWSVAGAASLVVLLHLMLGLPWSRG